MTFFMALVLGVLAGQFAGLSFVSLPGYELALYALLAIGLYGAVYGISLSEFKEHRRIVISAVTFGVVLKGLLIGGILWLFLKSPLAFLLGIIVAQIDPLSVSYLVDSKSSKFSAAGKTILRAWSSFDDPMTVLLGLYLFLPVALGAAFSFGDYGIQLAANLAFAGVLYLLRNHLPHWLLLIAAFALAIPFKLMLGIALCGLFLRPAFEQLPRLITAAFVLSAFILGTLVVFDIQHMLIGVLMGIVAFVAQALAAFVVARKLNMHDRLFLALAQYNGITSAILALVIGVFFPETVVIVATAVCVINGLYYSSNALLERVLHRSVAA